MGLDEALDPSDVCMSLAAAGMLLWCFFDLKRNAMMTKNVSQTRALNATALIGARRFPTMDPDFGDEIEYTP